MVKLFYRDSLLSLVTGPTIWALHFLLSYIAAAIYCAKFSDGGGFTELRLALFAITAVALGLIIYGGVQAADDWREAIDAEWAADADTLAMRRRFVGRAAFLLSGLSAIGVAYAGMTVLFTQNCQ